MLSKKGNYSFFREPLPLFTLQVPARGVGAFWHSHRWPRQVRHRLCPNMHKRAQLMSRLDARTQFLDKKFECTQCQMLALYQCARWYLRDVRNGSHSPEKAVPSACGAVIWACPACGRRAERLRAVGVQRCHQRFPRFVSTAWSVKSRRAKLAKPTKRTWYPSSRRYRLDWRSSARVCCVVGDTIERPRLWRRM